MDDELNNVPAVTALIISHRSTRMWVRHDPKETELQRQKSSADLTSTFLKNSEIFNSEVETTEWRCVFSLLQTLTSCCWQWKKSLCVEEMWTLFVIKQLIIPTVVVHMWLSDIWLWMHFEDIKSAPSSFLNMQVFPPQHVASWIY